MKTQQSGIRQAVAAAFLAGSLLCGTAWAGVMDAAQPLSFDASGTAVVNGTVTGGAPTIYSFWAKEGDVVTLDIDGTTPPFVDTIVSVHTPSPDFTVERVVDDTNVLDEGSVWPMDPLIEGWVVPADGTYYAVVTMTPDRVADGGTFVNLGGEGSGPFTLIVSGVSPEPAGTPPASTPPSNTPPDTTQGTPPDGGVTPSPAPTSSVKQVRIDIRPGQRALVRLNPKWKQTIPVAIFSSKDFDVRNVDKASLTFGRTGEESSLRSCSRHYAKWHRHHRYALVCYFENADAGFELGDEEGVLKGALNDGTSFEGRSMLRVLPEKRHYGHHHHGKGHDKRADNDRRRGGR